MTHTRDQQSDMAERMSTALATEGSAAALRSFQADLERLGMLDSVAEAIGLSPDKVVRLLSGKRSPPVTTVFALCRAAGLRFVYEVAPKPEPMPPAL